MTQTGNQPPARERGFALIVLAWFLVLLAAIGIWLVANARSETAIARNTVAAAKAEALADAGIAEAAFNLSDPDPAKRWALDGVPHRLALAGGEVLITATDESTKINPNLASAELLTGLFQALNIDSYRARHLGAAIADWVDKDPKGRQDGAEKPQYLDAGKNYGPPHAAIETLDELLLVLGMTPEIYAAARPYLTIYTQVDAPDPKLAPIVIQRALDFVAQTTDAANQSAAGAATAPTNTATGAAAATNANANAEPPIIANLEVRSHHAEGGQFLRRAVVRIDLSRPKGYVVLDWQRSDSDE